MRPVGRDEWTKVVGEFEKSGLKQKEFAEKTGISLGALQFWLYKLRRETKSPRFLPIHVVASAAPLARGDAVMVMEAALPSGLLLRFTVGTDPRYLAELFGALR
jgi:hypothetical protein